MKVTQTMDTPDFTNAVEEIENALSWADCRTFDTDEARKSVATVHGKLYEIARMLDKVEGLIP